MIIHLQVRQMRYVMHMSSPISCLTVVVTRIWSVLAAPSVARITMLRAMMKNGLVTLQAFGSLIMNDRGGILEMGNRFLHILTTISNSPNPHPLK